MLEEYLGNMQEHELEAYNLERQSYDLKADLEQLQQKYTNEAELKGTLQAEKEVSWSAVINNDLRLPIFRCEGTRQDG